MNDQDMSSIFEQINNLKKPISESKEKTVNYATSYTNLEDWIMVNDISELLNR